MVDAPRVCVHCVTKQTVALPKNIINEQLDGHHAKFGRHVVHLVVLKARLVWVDSVGMVVPYLKLQGLVQVHGIGPVIQPKLSHAPNLIFKFMVKSRDANHLALVAKGPHLLPPLPVPTPQD